MLYPRLKAKQRRRCLQGSPVPLPPEVATEEAEALLEPVLLEKAFCGPVPAAQAMAGSFSATLKMEPLPVLKTCRAQAGLMWCRQL